MTYQEVNTMISGIAGTTIPYAYNEFPDGTDQAPPFICFMFDDPSDDLMADNGNYVSIRPLTIELYTDNKDFALEGNIETALKGAGLAFTRSENYIEGERMYQINYNTEVVING